MSGAAAAFAPPTVRDALDGAVTAIAAAGSDTARLDAELLLAAALGVPRERLHTNPEHPVTGAAARSFRDHVRRRAATREPVAYILATKPFRHIELAVDPRALIPRPETELLVESALGLPPGSSVLDVGTGCGAVALALAHERPDLRVSATDISSDALSLARENATRLGLDVTLMQADLLDGVASGPWDAVLANLPYVPSDVIAGLEPEISRHEPALALDGGPDGLVVLRRLIAQVAERKLPLLALEIGDGQAAAVRELLCAHGFATVSVHSDLAGTERVLEGRR